MKARTPITFVLCYQGPEEPENQTTLLWASDDVAALKLAAADHLKRHGDEEARLTWKKYAGGRFEGRIRVRGIGAMIDFYDIQSVANLATS
jgi:hypothetical protein